MTETQMLIEQYKLVHEKKYYGTSAHIILKFFEAFIKELNPKSVLDYGCGQGRLTDKLGYIQTRVQYDPAIPEYAELPDGQFDLVIATDLLEHIPESGLDQVLSHIAVYSDNAVISISLIKAVEILPNGQNAHCTIKPRDWWVTVLKKYFEKVELIYEVETFVIFKTF